MKKVLSAFLALIMILSVSASASAATSDIADTGKTVVTIGDWVYEKIKLDTEWELDQYIGSDTEVIVPRILDDMIITAFGDHCFMNNTTVQSVITSSPLWNVGEYCFIDCTALENFECNYALNDIGVGAFAGTSSLKDINLEDSVVTEIKPYTFLNSGIEEVSLPDTCTKIGNYAFGQCYGLKKITIPASVTEIHDDAFKFDDNVVIYCYTDSAAHLFAQDKEIPFVLLDGPRTFILGDADNSGYIDVVDATFVHRYATHMYVPCEDTILNGDIDNSGEIEITDATYILRHLIHFKDLPYSVGEEVTR